MRVNVYTEELTRDAEIVTADYVSARTGMPMTNYGLRIYQKSHPDLHFIPGRDDDRTAVTFWCGADVENIRLFLSDLSASIDKHYAKKREKLTRAQDVES